MADGRCVDDEIQRTHDEILSSFGRSPGYVQQVLAGRPDAPDLATASEFTTLRGAVRAVARARFRSWRDEFLDEMPDFPITSDDRADVESDERGRVRDLHGRDVELELEGVGIGSGDGERWAMAQDSARTVLDLLRCSLSCWLMPVRGAADTPLDRRPITPQAWSDQRPKFAPGFLRVWWDAESRTLGAPAAPWLVLIRRDHLEQEIARLAATSQHGRDLAWQAELRQTQAEVREAFGVGDPALAEWRETRRALPGLATAADWCTLRGAVRVVGPRMFPEWSAEAFAEMTDFPAARVAVDEWTDEPDEPEHAGQVRGWRRATGEFRTTLRRHRGAGEHWDRAIEAASFVVDALANDLRCRLVDVTTGPQQSARTVPSTGAESCMRPGSAASGAATWSRGSSPGPTRAGRCEPHGLFRSTVPSWIVALPAS